MKIVWTRSRRRCRRQRISYNVCFCSGTPVRIGEAVDDDHEQIRLLVENINGIGPATSEAIAREYATLAFLRETIRERLEDVYGVSEETADAVLERVR